MTMCQSERESTQPQENDFKFPFEIEEKPFGYVPPVVNLPQQED